MRILNIPKLFTHEDPLHIHKLLGISSLIHYAYRAYLSYVSTNHSMSFDPTKWHTLALIVMHVLLSTTSLVFTIPRNRVRKLPMIWPEFRLHSIVFAYRSLLAMICFWLNAKTGMVLFHYARGIILLLTLASADLVTLYYKNHDMLLPGETTMRSMPFPEGTNPTLIRTTNLYYSISQVLATMNIIFTSNMNRPFAVLFPIQLAAFLMTLVRKSILTSGEWHVMYAGALGLNYVYAVVATTDNSGLISMPMYLFLASTFIILRFRYHVNKYILWSGIVSIFMSRIHSHNIDNSSFDIYNTAVRSIYKANNAKDL